MQHWSLFWTAQEERHPIRARPAPSVIETVRIHATRIDGRAVRYRRAGIGLPIVIVPGLGLTGRFYERNIADLAGAGFLVVAPDLPGFGGSAGPHKGLTIQEQAAWLAGFANHLELSGVIWVGHSLSCQAILALAADSPLMADAIALVGPTGGRNPRLLHQAWALAKLGALEPPRVIGAVIRDYIGISPITYLGYWLKAADDFTLEHAERVQCPALVLAGSRDPVPLRNFLSELVHAIPRSTFVQIPGALHAVPRERPTEFTRIIADFCSKVWERRAD